MAILGLDVSTSNLGFCIFDDNKLLDAGVLELSTYSKTFDKAVVVKNKLNDILSTNSISKILIEENLQSFRSGFSSAKTISTLARFNGVVSYISEEIFGVEPSFINVSRARSGCGIKINRKSPKSTKEQILDWVIDQPQFSKFKWPTKTFKSGPRKGKTVLSPSCYDIADAAVLCMYYKI